MLGVYIVPVLFTLCALLSLIALTQLFAVRRHWRARRRLACAHRGFWLAVFVALAVLCGILGAGLRGYRLLLAEMPVANIHARQLAPQQFAVRIDFPDGSHRSATLNGDEWQLDARVIKWTPRAVTLGAKPLYQVDRLSGRYHDPNQARTSLPSVVDLGTDSIVDPWHLKKDYPEWLPWIDADYGSATYLPLVDGGKYTVTISPLGGLIARAADPATDEKLKAAW
ncbi:MAG: hypothetical protein WBV39_16910 [Rudaea sp.]